MAPLGNGEDLFEKARNFALEKHKNQKRPDGITPFYKHLEGVVFRLKNIGIVNNEILSAAWIHDVLEKTETSFDEINEIFGNSVSVLVLSLTKDSNLPKKEIESQYVQQLKNASTEAKLIKLCDISANVKDVSNSTMSKTQKNKRIKKLFHYLRIIKKDLSEQKENYPKIQELIDGINGVGIKFRQRPIFL
ncbi:MAG: HD domain-containing protein [Nitrosopumilaceae archaeon]